MLLLIFFLSCKLLLFISEDPISPETSRKLDDAFGKTWTDGEDDDKRHNGQFPIDSNVGDEADEEEHGEKDLKHEASVNMSQDEKSRTVEIGVKRPPPQIISTSLSTDQLMIDQKVLAELIIQGGYASVGLSRWKSRYGRWRSPYLYYSELQTKYLLHRHVSVGAMVRPKSKRIFLAQSLIREIMTGLSWILVAILVRKCTDSPADFFISPTDQEGVITVVALENMEKEFVHLSRSGVPDWSLPAYHVVMENHKYYPYTVAGEKSSTFHFEGSGKYDEPDNTEPGMFPLLISIFPHTA